MNEEIKQSIGVSDHIRGSCNHFYHFLIKVKSGLQVNNHTLSYCESDFDFSISIIDSICT